MGACQSANDDAAQPPSKAPKNQWGHGHTLGEPGASGGASKPTREQLAAAAERRIGGGRGKTDATSSPSPAPTATTPSPGLASPRDASASVDGDVDRALRASAAEARVGGPGAARGHDGLSAEKRAELDEYRAKTDLLGRAEALYKRLGETAPFGLPSMTSEQLRRVVERLEARVAAL